jgi:siroheme synthase-like protein
VRYLPVGLRVDGEDCLVAGGGEIGTRKVVNLLRAGARVTVVAPAVSDELAGLADAGRIIWLAGTFRPDHLPGMFFAVAATDDPEENRTIAQLARESGVLACDASSSEETQVIFGALHEESGATVAIFTDGRDPGRARKLRDRIAGLLSGSES